MQYKLRDMAVQEFRAICTESNSIVEICKKIGLTPASTAYDRIRAKALTNNISLDHIGQGYSHNKGRKFPLQRASIETVLKSGQRGWIKQMLIRESLLEYKCQICKMDPVWNGSDLVLRLDHINGNPKDNALTNLRFVCPNCDSQLPTFSGRNIKHTKKKCADCDVIINRAAKRCGGCNGLRSRKIKWPDVSILLKRLENETYKDIANSLGCGANAIKKHFIRSGITPPNVPKGPRIRR